MKHRKSPFLLRPAGALLNKIKSNHLFQPTAALFLIALVVSLILSGANALTADRIEMLRTVERENALLRVAPKAQVFEELDYQTEDNQIVGLLGAYHGDTIVGYCVLVSPIGFGGAIDMVVGIDLNGNVTGVHILEHSETAGIGAQADNPDFLGQYTGKRGTINLNAGTNSIEAITGATITSVAINSGVNAALVLVSSLG